MIELFQPGGTREACQALQTYSMLPATDTASIQAQQAKSMDVKEKRKIYVDESKSNLEIHVIDTEQKVVSKAFLIGMLIELFLLLFLPWLFGLSVIYLTVHSFFILLGNSTDEEIRFRQFGYNWLLISPNGYSIAMTWAHGTFEYKQFQDYPLVRAETRTNAAEVEKLYLVTSSGNSLRFAGELDSEEAVWVARRINMFLDKQRAQASPVEAIAKLTSNAKQ